MRSYLNNLSKYYWLTILGVLLGLISGIIVANTITKSKYQATSSLYIYLLNDNKTNKKIQTQNESNLADSTYQSLKSSEMLVADFQHIIKTSSVLNELKKEYKPKDLKNLKDNISINVENSSRIIEISVANKNKNLAAKLANSIAKSFKYQTKKLLKIDTINILGNAANNITIIDKNKPLIVITFVFFGLFIGLCVIYIIDFYKLGNLKETA